MRRLWKVLLFSGCALAPVGLRAEPGMVVDGKARFTVITPNLIRMEYAPDDRFVDRPSWFAVNRDARDRDAKITQAGGRVEIDTGAIHLTYRDDGRPFSPANLQARIRKGAGEVSWQPGLPSAGNLGGTLRTLDGIRGPVPLGDGILSRDGWFLLDDSRSPLFAGDWIAERPPNGALDWYLFGYGLDFRAAFRSLTAAGGAVPLPRKYTLGIWYSRYWPYSADEFRQIVRQYAQHGFPLDMIVMDMDWHLNKASLPHLNTWTGYTWDRALIPDPRGLLRWFHDQGLHVTLNDHPAAGLQAHEEMYGDFMRAMGKDPASNQTIPFDAGSKPYLDTFYQYSHLPREKDGVDFWWLDWQQYPDTLSLPGVTNLQVLNFYNYTRSGRGGLRGESFSRWAGWGDHRYPIQFSGDADTGWKMLAFEVPFTSTGGNTGAFFWSNDIGGHLGGRNEESYARWCQFGAFSAALRSHSSRQADMDRRPWTYPDWAEASMRVSFRLRAEMMPYLYTCIRQATRDSVPFLRPAYIDYPGDEPAYHHGQEYFFGDNLLVAPIVQPGVGPHRVATQNVWFPKGDWYDFFTGERFTGPAEAIAADSIETFPLYVRGGVPLPMQAYTPRPGTAPLTDLVLRCYPGEDGKTGTSTVYEDDGVTQGYAHGESAATRLTYLRHGDEITVSLAPTEGGFAGQPTSRRCAVELPCTEKLTSCSLPEARTSYDDAGMMNRIELPETSIRKGFTLIVHAVEVDPAIVVQRAVARHLQDLLEADIDSKMTRRTALSDEMKNAYAAAQGLGVVEQSRQPYLLGAPTALIYCHNHQDKPEPVSVAVGNALARTVSLLSGDAIPGLPDGTGALPLGPAIPVTIEPPGGLVLHEKAPGYLPLDRDLALQATAEASSGPAAAAIDGSVLGYPSDQTKEWVTQGEKAGAWIKLTWPQAVQAGAVYLYDRPNGRDQVLGGMIEFDDGTRLQVGALSPDPSTPVRISFPAKPIRWMKFTVTQVSPKTKSVGLAEIAVASASWNPWQK